MSTKLKRRMIVVAGIIVIVLVVLLAVLGAGSAARVMSVSDAVAAGHDNAKVQVSGTVVDNSYAVDGDGVLTFSVRDEGSSSGVGAKDAPTLQVRYDKGVSATFGNGITAICTGRIDDSGTLQCSELVTKCPSKYENASGALSVSQLLGYGSSMVSKTAKVNGRVVAGSLADATKSVRLQIADEDGTTLPVAFGGALPDGISDSSAVVVTGALREDGVFLASDIALEG